MRRFALLLFLPLAGCGMHRAAQRPLPQPHYVLGAPWQAQGVWHYPHESFETDETGLATVYGDDHPALTTDGEAFDQDAMAAAHPTLQLPAVVRVTNLRNGRQVLLRVNDRGPAASGRLLEITRRAATLLGVPPGVPAEIRMQVEQAPSRALADALRPVEDAGLTAAPSGVVMAQSLGPPGGAPARTAMPVTVRPAAALASAMPDVPLRLPEQVWQVPPHPGRLWVRGAEFNRLEYAVRQQRLLAGMDARIDRHAGGHGQRFQVRAGPFATPAAADAALERALRRGVTDARIVVE